ncbi:hypothetical protein [Legionella brunensis]|uniref:Uncharacterized protein n=1 Tax=Legionella brunensis TaxID=29422 RepID=A0A0W0SJZ1_9GAMM|nr:hypothetical protein [Legionella brunensis]KTC83714.1 hypothetical protein Lbru_1683 [Legionella brunensis]
MDVEKKLSAATTDKNLNMLRDKLNKTYRKINHKRHECLTPHCKQDLGSTQNCHAISKTNIRTYEPQPNSLIKIVKDVFQTLFPGEEGRKFFEQFSINNDPTFKGFCNDCDRLLFNEVDGYLHVSGTEIPDIVLLQLHYRLVCYGIIDLERLKILNEGLLNYTESFQPGSEWCNTLKNEIIPKTALVYTQHLQVKEKCEYYLNKIKQSGMLPPQMPKIFLEGNKTNPLCFGRVGYYAYQYAYSEEEVISKFFYFLPFATFSSIVGERGESHLVFTSLTEDAAHLVPIIRVLEQPNWKDIIANKIYNFSDGCILRHMHAGMNGVKINDTLNYFIENSGLAA